MSVPEVTIMRLREYGDELACPKVVTNWQRVWQSDRRPMLTTDWPGDLEASAGWEVWLASG